MNEQVIEGTNLGGASVDFSLWGMFSQADIVVQIVMLVLVAASFWSWAIIFEKWLRFRRVKARTDTFEEEFWSGKPLDGLYERVGNTSDNPMAMLFVAAMREWYRSAERGGRRNGISDRLEERIHRVMRVTMAREMGALERYLGFLATVGATAVFIGLFGTVWGIMNSFQAIALSHNTSLAVVAPGIAEALLATALGLIAAIPAVAAYNKFANDIGQMATQLENFMDEFTAILSRRLEQEG